MRAAILSVLVLVLVTATASADAVLVGRITDLLGKPIAGARVHVLAGGAEHQAVETDPDGNYRVVVDGDQEISVVIGAGNLHTFRRGSIKNGSIKRLDLEVETTEGEIIRIIDEKPPAIPPKLPKDLPRVTPEYSEEAVERDAWAKAWLILDIDERGKVVRVKLLKRPGFDLDKIAVKEAMKLRFEPARDEHGRPMRTQMLWALEWPSHGWLVEHNGTAAHLPQEGYALNPFLLDFGGVFASPITGAAPLSHVPCAGSGPLNLDLLYPVYRDCSKPNLKKAPFLSWLDGTQPIPPDPPQFARKPEPPLHLSRASYIPQIAASSVTGLLLAATIVSYVKFDKYSHRVSKADLNGLPVLDLDQYRSNHAHYQRWQRRSIVGAIATVAAGGFATSLWFRHQRRTEFSVQPEDDGGGSLTVSGSF